MVTEVPPVVGPVFGLMPVTTGCGGVVKVNWSAGAFSAEVPPGVVTVTSTVAADSGGAVAVMDTALLTVKDAAVVEPNATALAPVKPVPVMVTEVPPAVDPDVGASPVTVGCGGVVNVNWSAGVFSAEVPPGVVTVMSTVAAARRARWR